MPLSAGTRLGPYEILAALGAGGMGEVYRARDTRLDRMVAIKVLPAALATDPQFRERFDREARAISQLTHPHICTLYDVGEHDGTASLVMEYLEGETLADRLKKGALPLDQALKIAMQVADALNAAHRHGIVHRDLKPGNVMLTKAGAKLLDFGLAKASGPAIAGAGLSMLPTTPANLTAHGTILGTFQYMAPEQLDGRDADARTDIFAFGAVVYEMVTGRKAFDGKSQASVIAAILEREPPALSSIEPLAPPGLDRVVRKCLAKDPEARWHSAHDLHDELQWIAEPGSPSTTSPLRPWRVGRGAWTLVAVASVVLTALAAAVVTLLVRARERSSMDDRIHVQLSLPPGSVLTTTGAANSALALSPDGRSVALVAAINRGPLAIWVHPLDRPAGATLAGTEGASYPFWSPDGQSIGFFVQGKLKRINVAGGPPQTLCDAPEAYGGAWNRDGVIVFGSSRTKGLFRVLASGGPVTVATTLDQARHELGHRFPQFLPDGRHFLLFVSSASRESRGLAVGSLDSHDTTFVLATNFGGQYAQDYLLSIVDGGLVAHRFDVRTFHVVGEPTSVVDGVWVTSPAIGYAAFAVADRGLMYISNVAGQVQLTSVTRTGQPLGSIGPASGYLSFQLSPDGERVALNPFDPQTGDLNIWLFDLARGTRSRFTFDTSVSPMWSPDGRRLAFAENRVRFNDLYEKSSIGGGPEELLLTDDANKFPTQWSADGRFLVYHRPGDHTGFDIWMLPLDGARKPTAYLQTPFNEMQGQLSPDGRWMAYTSDESGQLEVYVQSVPAGAGKWQVSTTGGSDPHWRRDGRELFYLAADRRLMAVPVVPSSSFQAGIPQVLFNTQAEVNLITYFSQYDVSADGKRFVFKLPVEVANVAPINVVFNWTAALKK